MGSFYMEPSKPAVSKVQASSVTASLASTSLFKYSDPCLSMEARSEVTYQRAKAIARAYGLTALDVVFLRSKFWALHMDQICSMDGAATALLTTQYNLVAGTLAPFAFKRPELQPLLQQILDFDISAQFLLSEVGHGLDSPNLETVATLLPTGEFDLHTPSPQAAKWIPTVIPHGSLPRVGIVIARLEIAGENFGVRPFVVALGDGEQMCSRITSKPVPNRAGTRPADHSILYFNHVILPYEALLGTLDMPKDLRQNFLQVIWRVGIGSLAFSNLSITAFKSSVYVAGQYSIRRTVTTNDGQLMPIIAFRAQQTPVMHALAEAFVLDAFGKYAVGEFANAHLDPRVRHAIAAVLKVMMVQHCQDSLYTLAECCGAQGVYEYHQIIESQIEMRGIALAEGDMLSLSIRLASELLSGRYEMPPPSDPSSLLARHEAGLYDEARAVVLTLTETQRSEEFTRLVLPLCQPLIEAIGHRMAYEAAVRAGVDADVIALYVAGALQYDASWYVEHLGITRRQVAEMEDRALSATFPRLEDLLEQTGAAPYCTAPIISDEVWAGFVENLPGYEGDAVFNVIPGAYQAAASESPYSRL